MIKNEKRLTTVITKQQSGYEEKIYIFLIHFKRLIFWAYIF